MCIVSLNWRSPHSNEMKSLYRRSWTCWTSPVPRPLRRCTATSSASPPGCPFRPVFWKLWIVNYTYIHRNMDESLALWLQSPACEDDVSVPWWRATCRQARCCTRSRRCCGTAHPSPRRRSRSAPSAPRRRRLQPRPRPYILISAACNDTKMITPLRLGDIEAPCSDGFEFLTFACISSRALCEDDEQRGRLSLSLLSAWNRPDLCP